MQRNRDYKPEPMELTHVQEVLQLLSIMTGDHRFEDVLTGWTEGSARNMCEVLSRIEDRGITKGHAEGRAEGISEMVSILRGIGVNEEQIAEAVRISKEKANQSEQIAESN